ncbi:MAG: hypothetical protein AB7G13_05580 [Lautropia sp.]
MSDGDVADDDGMLEAKDVLARIRGTPRLPSVDSPGPPPPPVAPPSGRPDNGGVEDLPARVAKLESDVGHIRTDVRDIKDDMKEFRRDARVDFRLLFGSIIATTLALAGLRAKSFGWL